MDFDACCVIMKCTSKAEVQLQKHRTGQILRCHHRRNNNNNNNNNRIAMSHSIQIPPDLNLPLTAYFKVKLKTKWQ